MKTPAFLLVATAICLTPSAQAQSVEVLGIERKSAYQAPAERSPFWPIGWAPVDPNAAVAAPVVRAGEDLDLSFFDPQRFALTSISIDRIPLAMINGRAYSVGDLVPINAGHSAEVIAIRDGGAQLRFRTKTIDVPLRLPGARQPARGAK